MREAAVVAVPDATYGEVVGAFVVIEDEPAEIEANVEASTSIDSDEQARTSNGKDGDVDSDSRASELVEAAADEEPLTGSALRAWVSREMNPQVCVLRSLPTFIRSLMSVFIST